MAVAPRHIFMILTKRPERMREYVSRWRKGSRAIVDPRPEENDFLQPWPLPNVWLGVSAEDQEWADKRIPILLETPAAVRFVSYEPALGLVDFHAFLHCNCSADENWDAPEVHAYACPYRRRLDWIIVGGESGPRARPFDLAWARSAVAQAHEAGARAFVKQLGAQPEQGGMGWGPYGLRMKNRHGSDTAEWPEDLRIREFPR
jgi:protein gp37